MALWKDPTKDPSMPGTDGAATVAPEPAVRPVPTPVPSAAGPAEPARRVERVHELARNAGPEWDRERVDGVDDAGCFRR